MKKDCQSKIIKGLVLVNVVLVALVGVLFMQIYSLQRQIDGMFTSLKSGGFNAAALEVDLRNRGIIDGKLLTGGERKPYSLEQMNEFKKWAEEQNN